MKTTNSISVILLLAGAVYGIIDYRNQIQKGNLEKLYKDEKYNGTKANKRGNATEETTASTNENTGATKEVNPISEKSISAEAFSRAALEPIEEEALVIESNYQPNKEAAATEKLNTKTKNKNYVAIVQDDSSTIIAEEIEIEPEAKSTADTSKAVEEEKEFVRVSEFSRAPIRKKGSNRIAKKH